MDKTKLFDSDDIIPEDEAIETEDDEKMASLPRAGKDLEIFFEYSDLSPYIATKRFTEDIISKWPKTTFPGNPTGEQMEQIGALKLMACDHPSDEVRGFALQQFIDRLDRFCFEQLRHAAPTYFDRITAGDTQLKDEVRSACKEQIILHLPKYDYMSGVPITFFKPYMRSGLRIVTNKDGYGMSTPSHYAEKNKVVLKAMQELEAQGLPVDVENIRDLTGESRQVITEAMQRLSGGGRVTSLDNEEMKEVADNRIPNPAESLIKKESDRLLRQMRHEAGLTPLETLIACVLRDRAEKGKTEKKQEIVDAVNRIIDQKNARAAKDAEVQAAIQQIKDQGLPPSISKIMDLTGFEQPFVTGSLERIANGKVAKPMNVKKLTTDQYTVLRSTMITKMTDAARTGKYGDEIKAKYGRSRTPSNICVTITQDDSIDREMDSIARIDLDTGVKQVEHGEVTKQQAEALSQNISIFLADPMPEEGKTVASVYTRSQGRSMCLEVAGGDIR